MANPPSLIMSYAGSTNSFLDTFQEFWPVVQFSNQPYVFAGIELGAQTPFLAGTISNLWCRVTTAATSTSTMVSRINEANGNMSISITANATGAFTDASNHDGVNNNDLVCYGITAGSTSLVMTIAAITFVAQVNTNTKLGPLIDNNPGNGTYFITPSGFSALGTTESFAKLRLRKAMTVKNLSFALTNGSSGGGSWTIVSRKNGANGNLALTLSGTTAKIFQDTTHSDSLSVGDDFDFQSTVTGSFNPTQGAMAADFVSTAGDCIFMCGYDNTTSFSTGVINYFGLSGSLDTGQTTETNAQVTVNNAFKFSQLAINVTSNNITLASAVDLRANGAATGVTVSILASQTGILIDNTDTYTASATDSMNYRVITGVTGGSMKISFIEVYGNATAGAATAGPKYQDFGSQRQAYNSFGGQLIIFG